MASEASRKKVKQAVRLVLNGPNDEDLGGWRAALVESLAAALDEARAEGERAGEQRGAELERWANHQIAATRRAQHEIPHPCGEDETIRLQVGARWLESSRIASEISARGAMRGPDGSCS